MGRKGEKWGQTHLFSDYEEDRGLDGVEMEIPGRRLGFSSASNPSHTEDLRGIRMRLSAETGKRLIGRTRSSSFLPFTDKLLCDSGRGAP